MADIEHLKKLGQWKERIFLHGVFKEYVEIIDERMQLATASSEVSSLSILGESGCGKTWIAKYFQKVYPPYYEKKLEGEQLIVPVTYMRLPPTSAVTDTIKALLDSLNVTYANSDSISNLTKSLINALKNAQTRLVFLDEIQQLNDSAGVSVATIMNWLKRFIDDAGVPVAFLGLPNANRILRGDELGRRVKPNLTFDPFPLPTSKNCSLTITLKVLSEFLVADVHQSLTTVDDPILLAQRLWLASGGRIGQMRSLIFDAALRASKSTSKTITLKEFAAAYSLSPPDTTLIKKGNPFTMEPGKITALAYEHGSITAEKT